ncbi:bacillithiol system redox-active protein YtxJ [Bacillus sinesaloumensis]|uniref:bacillithiol system redox-active protein YtxJ n=1 Tax=Litchfieldia sinesaloumensis TaxID=1926280 RepID=UPI00098846D4|nr:bacillithiol system redox-active protein YtxJ [Bacillus sinesaloumensis]
MGKTKVETIEEFNQVLENENKFIFIKHSLTCPISKAAFDEYEQFTAEHGDVPSYYLYVQEAKELSNYIAETFEIKHESPQALLFEGGKVKWDTSHRNITKESLVAAGK